MHSADDHSGTVAHLVDRWAENLRAILTQVRLTVKQGLFLSALIFSADSLTVFVQLTGAVASINICTSIMAAIPLFGRTRIMQALVGMVSAVLCSLVEKTNKPKVFLKRQKKIILTNRQTLKVTMKEILLLQHRANRFNLNIQNKLLRSTKNQPNCLNKRHWDYFCSSESSSSINQSSLPRNYRRCKACQKVVVRRLVCRLHLNKTNY